MISPKSHPAGSRVFVREFAVPAWTSVVGATILRWFNGGVRRFPIEMRATREEWA